jgi:hypothetical protein
MTEMEVPGVMAKLVSKKKMSILICLRISELKEIYKKSSHNHPRRRRKEENKNLSHPVALRLQVKPRTVKAKLQV